MTRRRRFNFDFKRQAVLDVLEKRVGVNEMARKHSTSHSLIRHGSRSTKGNVDELDKVGIAQYQGKIAELERKVGRLTIEVDFLKQGGTRNARATTITISSV